jgi:hypothetical protein
MRADPADHHRGAQGLPRQPDLPGADHRALLPRQSAGRHGDEGAVSGHAGQCLGRHRQPQGHRLLRPQGRDALGAHGDLRGLLWRPARQGRHGRGRHTLRQHAQQPDRGHRDPPAAARAALRAARGRGRRRQVARRPGLGARVHLPLRRRRLGRRRRASLSAVGISGRQRGHAGQARPDGPRPARPGAALEGAVHAYRQGRPFRLLRPGRRRLRQSRWSEIRPRWPTTSSTA